MLQAQGGLVVVDARYGVLEAIVKAEAEQREHATTGEAATSASDAAASMDEAPGPSTGACNYQSFNIAGPIV